MSDYWRSDLWNLHRLPELRGSMAYGELELTIEIGGVRNEYKNFTISNSSSINSTPTASTECIQNIDKEEGAGWKDAASFYPMFLLGCDIYFVVGGKKDVVLRNAM
ncbi:hypothetical protein GDO81_000387 [Engystomops pustulosus]|nr:hypothetical protein GDO81_000387 [Engystomops pustulosus]